jgi:hypothetical protein
MTELHNLSPSTQHAMLLINTKNYLHGGASEKSINHDLFRSVHFQIALPYRTGEICKKKIKKINVITKEKTTLLAPYCRFMQ